MQKKYALIIVGILVWLSPAASAQNTDGFASINISETAAISVAPNLAEMFFEVESNSDSAQAAVRKNAERTAQVLEALKKAGHPEDTIETSGVQLAPIYTKDHNGQPKGYRASNRVVLKTRNLEKLGAYIDAASGAEVSRFGNLVFRTNEEEELRKKAAVRALKQAMATAQDLAAAAGLSIKKVHQISYTPTQVFPKMVGLARAESVRTPIEVGNISIQATVHMVFEVH